MSATAATSTFRMNDTLPVLEIRYPVCGHCGNDVEIDDDVASCWTCRVSWERIEDGAVAKPDDYLDGTEVPCEVVKAAGLAKGHTWTDRGKTFVIGDTHPCILPSGHEGDHLCPEDVTVTEQASA